jgi:putative MATE family efflux protein
VGQAGSSVAAQHLGARRGGDVPQIYLSLLAFNLAAGLVASTMLFALHHQLPGWLGLSGRAEQYARDYLAILGAFQFLKAVQSAYASMLGSRGATEWILAEATVTNVTNILLNVAFLKGWLGLPNWGVRGVAVSTVVSLALGMLFTIGVVHLRIGVRFPFSASRSDLALRLRPILRIGLPSALEPIAYQGTQIVVNRIVMSLGTTALAARIYVTNFFTITTMLWAQAFGVATQIIIAHRIGEERYEVADRELRRALWFSALGNLAFTGCLFVFRRELMSVLTQDPQVIEMASPLFLVAFLVEAGRAVNIVAGGALRSSGDARYTSGVGSAMMWLVGLPSCYVAAISLGWGLTGVWAGMAIDELSRGVVNYRRWKAGQWRSFRAIAR